MDEKDLVNGLINGDDKAFDFLIDLYGNDILRLCYMRVSDIAVAEDLTQETLIAVFKYIGGFKGKSSFKTWIYKIAINTCNKYHEKISKEKAFVTYVDFRGEKENLLRESEDYNDKFLKEADKNIILNAVEGIDKKYKEVIYMFYYDELSIKEIALILDKGENTIKTLLRRGRGELKKVLSKEDLYA